MKNKQVKRMMCNLFYGHWLYIKKFHTKEIIEVCATSSGEDKGLYFIGLLDEGCKVSIKADEVKK